MNYLKFGKFTKIEILIICLIVSNLGIYVGYSENLKLTPAVIFKQIEENTQRIYSLRANLEISFGHLKLGVKMLLQSPDKFALLSDDDNFEIIFDGETLWMYINSLKEAYKLDTSSGGVITSYMKSLVNPKKIINSITRKSLFNFFEINLVDNLEITNIATSDDVNLYDTYGMCFIPKLSNYVKKIFDIGYYYVFFSKQNYLPVYVVEIGVDKNKKGSLKVLEYSINEFIPSDNFKFEVKDNITVLSFTNVIFHKLQNATHDIYEKVINYFK